MGGLHPPHAKGVSFQDVMRDMKKFTSKEISRQFEKDGQRLSL